jgi:hypothetical protein
MSMTTLIPAVLVPVAALASVGVRLGVRARHRREEGMNRVLGHLALRHGSTQEEIVRETGLEDEQVARIVEELRALGKVDRRASYGEPGILRHRLVTERVVLPAAGADVGEPAARVHGPE